MGYRDSFSSGKLSLLVFISLGIIALTLIFLFVLKSPFSFPPAQISSTINSGLLAYWTFNESSGSTAADSSGNGKTANLFGTSFVSGKIGNAISFSGSDSSYASVNVQTPSTYTVAMWIYPKSSGGWQSLVSESGSYALQIADQGGRLVADFFHSSSWDKYGTVGIPLNHWAHLVFVNNNGQVSIYVNGNLDVGGISTESSGINVLYIGKDPLGQPYNGLIDDLRIYNRALSASEIQELYSFSGGPVVINGACGTANRTYTVGETFPGTYTLCSAGTPNPSNPTLSNTAGASVNWQCLGSNGGTNASCSASRAADTTPPQISNTAPSGTLSYGTTSTTLSLTTNEPATCKYSTSPNTFYSAMQNTFSTTGGTSHSTTVSGLTNGGSYNYYVRCQDSSGNANTADSQISFSVAATQTVSCTNCKMIREGGIAPIDNGSNCGSNWTNACSRLPTILIRGYTYYLADGNYPSYTFSTLASGTTFIYIKKATIQDHGTDAGWQDSMGDGQAVFGPMSHNVGNGNTGGYIDINGYSPHIPGNYGIKIKFGKQNSPTSWEGIGFNFDSGTGHAPHMKFKYIDFAGPAGPNEIIADCDGGTYTYALRILPWDGSKYSDTSNMLISHSALHGVVTMIQDNSGNNNIVIEYSDFFDSISTNTNCDHGNIYWVGSSNGTFRYNKVHNYNVEGLLFGLSNSGWKVYGNVFYDGKEVARGIELYGGKNHTNTLIYGNTFVNMPLASVRVESGAITSGVQITNNLIYNSYNSRGIGLENGGSGVTTSNNLVITDPSYFVNLNNDDYRLAKPTPQSGTRLEAPYDVDPDGRKRGADGFWDIGAYEYVSTSLPPLNGACGTANRTYTVGETFPGTYTLCSAGTPNPSNPTLSNTAGASVNWQCLGSNGGTNASCSASRAADTTPPSPPANVKVL